MQRFTRLHSRNGQHKKAHYAIDPGDKRTATGHSRDRQRTDGKKAQRHNEHPLAKTKIDKEKRLATKMTTENKKMGLILSYTLKALTRTPTNTHTHTRTKLNITAIKKDKE